MLCRQLRERIQFPWVQNFFFGRMGAFRKSVNCRNLASQALYIDIFVFAILAHDLTVDPFYMT